MREFIKGLIIVCLFACAIAGAFAWINDRPGSVAWILRVGGPVGAVGFFVLFLIVHFKRDRVPDFLYQEFGGYFDRDGLCFAHDAIIDEGVCYLRAHFQNRYSEPCQVQIALRPARGFFLTRSSFQSVSFEIDCPPAGYGVARVPVPISREFQGNDQKFEVGASVRYPNGHGTMMRFRDGVVIRTNSKFGNPFGTVLGVAGALTGQVVLSSPASVTVTLPVGVAEELPAHVAPSVQILWLLEGNSHRGQTNSINVAGR